MEQYQWNIGDKILTDVGGKGIRRRGIGFSGFEKENGRGVVAAEGEGDVDEGSSTVGIIRACV